MNLREKFLNYEKEKKEKFDALPKIQYWKENAIDDAKKNIEELTAENPAYADIRIDWIEESEHPEIAEQRDYYSVPTIYFAGEKLYEASPRDSFDTIKARFRARLRGALPVPVEKMLEKKHGIFDGGVYDYSFDGVNGDAAALGETLKKLC